MVVMRFMCGCVATAVRLAWHARQASLEVERSIAMSLRCGLLLFYSDTLPMDLPMM